MKTVCLDMDGVIVDFNAGFSYPPDTTTECGEPWYSDPKEMYEKGFFENLKPLSIAQESISKLLSDYDIELHIASKPIPNGFCASEKYLWVAKYFPDLLKRTHLLQEKGLLLADYLIDDDIRWKDKFKGTFIQFKTSKPEESWEMVFETLKKYRK